MGQSGTVCTSNERPDILADELEHKQWAIDPNREKHTLNHKLLDTSRASGRTKIVENIKVDTGPITVEGITRSIKKLKNNRSAGPDDIPVGFFKLMDESTLTLLCEILNNC